MTDTMACTAGCGMDRRRVYDFMPEEVMAEAARQQAPAQLGGLVVELDEGEAGKAGQAFAPQSPRSAQRRAERLAEAVRAWREPGDRPAQPAAPVARRAAQPPVQVLARVRLPHAHEVAAEGTASERGAPLYTCVGALPTSAELVLHAETPALGGAGTGCLRTSRVQLDGVIGAEGGDEELFAAAEPMLGRAAEGGTAVHFVSYGPTGTGKTHSSRALARFAAELLFSRVAPPGKLWVSFFEVAGSRCYDLLAAERPEVAVLEDGASKVCLQGLSEVAASTAAEALEAVDRGFACRRTAATEANAGSSRTHAVCELRLSSCDGAEDAEAARPGLVRICDLAGSERSQDTLMHSAERMREAKEVNWSLACLRDCVRACASAAGRRGGALAPFRRCRLTLLLRECFEAGALCVWLAHVAPMSANLAATRGTLKCAEELVLAASGQKTGAAAAQPLPQTWSRGKVAAWLRGHDGGRFAHLEGALSWADGHALGQDWPRDVAGRAKCSGAEEENVLQACEAFRRFCKARAGKAAASGAKPQPAGDPAP